MDVKEAVKTALEYVQEMFGPQAINLALEEVDYDEQNDIWLVTVGFSRPWDRSGTVVFQGTPVHRYYKVVRVRPDGNVASVKHRDL